MGVRLSGGNLGSVCLLSRKEILVVNAVLNLVEGNIFSILIVRRTSRRMICPLNFSKVTSQSSLIFNFYNFFTYSRSLSSTSTIPWTSVICRFSLRCKLLENDAYIDLFEIYRSILIESIEQSRFFCL